MAFLATLERVADMRNAVNRKPRITMTDLARDTSWKKALPEQGIIEVTERGDTAAWLVSNDYMAALMEEIAELETAVEYAEVSRILEAREPGFRPLAGDELRQAIGAEWASWAAAQWESAHADK